MDSLLLLAVGELEALQLDFGIGDCQRSRVIPNGVDVDPEITIDQPRDIDILLVGRVEERKNQLAVLEALASRPELAIHVVGPLTARSPSYRSAFQELLGKSTNVVWHGSLSPAQIPPIYSRSKVVINASFVEVLSLVEMESLAYGCNLIGSRDGHTAEFFGAFGQFISAEEVSEQLMPLVNSSLAKPPNLEAADLIRREFTWKAAASKLGRAYVEAAE
jgi:glycosyltransferase involved in cell wall biosynthesis